MTQDAFNQALANAGAGEKIRAAFNKYSQPGERHGGTVVARDLFQSRDLKTGDLETWDDGNPIMKAKIVIQTDERGPANEDGTPDDGRRYIVVKWFGDDLKALKDAVGTNDFEVGGWFGAIYEREDEPAKAGFNGRKVYSYVYRAPAFMPQDQQQAPAPQPQQAPPAQPQFQQPAPVPQQAPAPQFQQPAPAPQAAPGWAAPEQAQQPRTAEDYRLAAMNGPQAAPAPQQAPAPQAAPALQPAAAPQPGGMVDATQIQAFIAQGYTDEDIIAGTGASPQQVAMVRQLFPGQ